MALKGSFNKLVSGNFGIICNWKGTQNQSGNYTTITLDVYLQYYHLYVGSRDDGIVSINGKSSKFSTSAISSSTDSWKTTLLKSYSIKVPHDADGKKTNVELKASWRYGGTYGGASIGTITASTTVDLDAITVYKLSTSAGTGSKISVSRTASGFGKTGTLSSGATLYKNDKLKITFTPDDDYSIVSHTVNGASFSSGATHTVASNVTIKSTAQKLTSSISASNANIESKSTITITKHSATYYHSIKYKFGTLTGFIKSDGSISTTESKYKNTSVSFAIPKSFYAQIKNKPYGECTLTCTTYGSANSTSALGDSTSCTIRLTASKSLCAPTISGSVTDVNNVTTALTGDSNVLIKYKSSAKCTITATARNEATISKKYINGVNSSERTIENVTDTKFIFSATDSRGYSSTVSVTPEIIDYIPLTMIPKIARQTPTNGNVVLSISGKYYNGEFSTDCHNTLSIKYRYKASTEANYPSSWNTISGITIGTNSYSLPDLVIGGGTDEDPGVFDYQQAYDFEIEACDGITNQVLSKVTKYAKISTSVPIFDWGKNDFRFNVPVKFNLLQSAGAAFYDITNKNGGGLNMGNSDITGINGLWFNDASEPGNREGINFSRNTGNNNNENWDVFAVYEGKPYIILNYPTNTSPTYLAYTAGDVISLDDICFSGYITTSSKVVVITVPLDKPMIGVSTATVSGGLTLRGVGGRVYPPAASVTDDKPLFDLDNPVGFTAKAEVQHGTIRVVLKFTTAVVNSNGAQYSNNTPISATSYTKTFKVTLA